MNDLQMLGDGVNDNLKLEEMWWLYMALNNFYLAIDGK